MCIRLADSSIYGVGHIQIELSEDAHSETVREVQLWLGRYTSIVSEKALRVCISDKMQTGLRQKDQSHRVQRQVRYMTREHVDHGDIAHFAADRVNLSRDRASEYRAQARRLRERLDAYLSEHPDFMLKKILMSGSLAKGTALSSLNDIDMGCYISGADTRTEVAELLSYLAERLRKAFPNFKPEQVTPQTYSVTVSFKGTGLDVDIVPILYDGDPDWYGHLVSQDDGTYLKTNIPFHLEFIRKRKRMQEQHFAQVVRLVKFWVRNVKQEREDFRFKSFMIELIMAYLCDQGCDFSDYPEALQHFFTYVARTAMGDPIIFSDYYSPSEVMTSNHPIRIFDPVNPENNVGKLYTEWQAEEICDVALDAGDSIDSALRAPTKGKTIYYWQKVFGPSFDA